MKKHERKIGLHSRPERKSIFFSKVKVSKINGKIPIDEKKQKK